MGLFVVKSDDPGLRFAAPWAIESRPVGAALLDRVTNMTHHLRFLLIASLAIATLPSTARAADFQAGLAVVDITPPKNYRMSGYFNERLNTGTHDPLSAKAVVFRQGNQQAALVFCDLIGISFQVSRQARGQASQKTGIPAA